MKNQSLQTIDKAALLELMSPEEIANFNSGFSEGISADFLPTISIRGGKLRAKIEGQENDLPAELPIIFISARPSISKTYYADAYNPRVEAKEPDCSSVDGLYPDSSVKRPQAANCKICPHNEFGSRGNGSHGKACGDYKQVTVMIEGVDQAFGLRIPPTSFKPFNAYVKQLDMAGIPLIAVRSILTLVGDEYPIINLRSDGFVSRDVYEIAKEWASSDEVKQLVNITSTRPRMPDPPPASQLPPHGTGEEIQKELAAATTKRKARKAAEPEPTTPEPSARQAQISAELNALLAGVKK